MKKLYIVLIILLTLTSCNQIKQREKTGSVLFIEEKGDKVCQYWEATFIYRNIFEHQINIKIGSPDLYHQLNMKMQNKEKISITYYDNSLLSCGSNKEGNILYSIGDANKLSKGVLGNMIESISSLINKKL